MPKRNARSRTDIDRGQWEPSSSSEEDWGNGEWEVLRIAKDHVNTRGDLRFNVEWAHWERDDGSNSTWEAQNGTTMRDLALVQKRWQKSQDVDFAHDAESPTVSPFTPSACREDLPDENANEEKKPRSERVHRYTFTELAYQARQMAIHLKDEDEFAGSSSLIGASVRLQDMRSTRSSALQALDTSISEAPSLCLYDLGPAPQRKVRYQAQKKTPLHHQMRTLHVSKFRAHTGISRAASSDSEPLAAASLKQVAQVQASSSSGPENMSFSRLLKHLEQPIFKHPVVLSQDVRPVPQRLSSQPDVESRASDYIMASGPKRRRKIPLGSSIACSPLNSSLTPMPPPAQRVPSLRDALQAKWSKAVQIAGAASVTVVDDFDTKSAPVSDISAFTYLESGYIFGYGVPQPDENFMESCECTLGCTASLCSCQDDSLLQDDDGDSLKAFAYDDKGLFAFHNMRSYVIECNKKCACDARCHSRVAQRPRKFPMEIFRTERCGWGVRSTVALPRGSVLGVYTGKVIPRPQSSEADGKHGNYIFDLDFFQHPSADQYSIDAYNCGNWTRFVNHSCNPVCSIYPVVWDSAASMHQPKLAFVANIDIPARSELSIDYSPKVRKGKRKARPMPGTPECMCGAEDCRGFIYNV